MGVIYQAFVRAQNGQRMLKWRMLKWRITRTQIGSARKRKFGRNPNVFATRTCLVGAAVFTSSMRG